MNSHQMDIRVNRREFLSKGLVNGMSLCIGCSVLASLASAQDSQDRESFRTKVAENSGMSFEQVFRFAFRDSVIPQLLAISRQVGRDRLVDMLKAATDEIWFRKEVQRQFYANLPEGFWTHVVDIEVLEKTAATQTYKVTRCLWAEIFRAASAADIGYAMWCYGDYALARSEKKVLDRDRTLMQGDDYCLLKYTKET